MTNTVFKTKEYRIVEEKGYYFPQHQTGKILGFIPCWVPFFKDSLANLNKDVTDEIRFDNFTEAEDFLKTLVKPAITTGLNIDPHSSPRSRRPF